MKKIQQNILKTIETSQQKMATTLEGIAAQIQNCCTLIASITDQQNNHSKLLQQCEDRDAKLEKQMADLSNVLDIKIDQSTEYSYDLNEKIKQAQAEIQKVY